jgi:small GTP-binding protein
MEQHSNFKVVVIGDSGVGKSTLVRVLQGLSFDPKHVKTLGVNVDVVRVGRRYQHVVFNMWDCAGDPKFAGLDTRYYVQADAFLVCFDLTTEVTLRHCRDWLEKIKSVGLGDKPCILVGIKADLTGKASSHDQALKLYPSLYYHEVSTKTSKGVAELMSFLLVLLKPTSQPESKL